MTTEPEVYVHIPGAGRCGPMLSLKNDLPYCVRLRDSLTKEDKRIAGFELAAKEMVDRALDEDDMCGCYAYGQGVVWSQVMSSMPEDGEQEWVRYMQPVGEFEQRIDDEDMQHHLVVEARMREAIMTQDVSLSSGERYKVKM